MKQKLVNCTKAELFIKKKIKKENKNKKSELLFSVFTGNTYIQLCIGFISKRETFKKKKFAKVSGQKSKQNDPLNGKQNDSLKNNNFHFTF